jgi:hypothetical protein
METQKNLHCMWSYLTDPFGTELQLDQVLPSCKYHIPCLHCVVMYLYFHNSMGCLLLSVIKNVIQCGTLFSESQNLKRLENFF